MPLKLRELALLTIKNAGAADFLFWSTGVYRGVRLLGGRVFGGVVHARLRQEGAFCGSVARKSRPPAVPARTAAESYRGGSFGSWGFITSTKEKRACRAHFARVWNSEHFGYAVIE